jgi:hypothetical protein
VAQEPGVAASVKEELRQVFGEGQFSSLGELQAEANRIVQRRNSLPLAEFHALSPEQMYRILNFPFASPSYVRFADPLAQEPEAPLVTLFELLVAGIGEKGVKATARGNLPRALCREVALKYMGEEGYQKRTRYAGINKEEDFYDLHVTRLVAEMAGLIRVHRGRFILSRDGQVLHRRSGMAAIYPRLLRVFVEEFNWAYGDGYDELAFIQHSFLFTLYLLNRYGDKPRPSAFYEEAYLHAFPALVEEVGASPYSTPRESVGRCYVLRTFEQFAKFFGLARLEQSEYAGGASVDCTISSTPLLDSVVSFVT